MSRPTMLHQLRAPLRVLLFCITIFCLSASLIATTNAQDVDHRSPEACGNPEIATQVMPASAVPAFTNLRIPRPIIICDAGDGSNRLFIASQQGVIHVLADDDQDAEEAEVFFDLSEAVTYKDRENEEGFLGLAFHPKFKENGHLFIYYTSASKKNLSVISRFTVSADDKNKVDPQSELQLMEIQQPAWNHNGGTLQFGPDGYLYVGLGDGGAANDVFGNGQNLKTLLGSILRIDVDNHDEGKNYSVPTDNPFVNQKDARPEIWAYGLRNVWRMSFDSKSGQLWAADVGQDLWEEIDLIQKGGNYGWSRREAMHPFGNDGAEPSEQFVEPIWEYHHAIGKSITGGLVYRGKAIPELDGVYLFADYVTGKMWGLKYDLDAKQVTAHYELPLEGNIPVMTFGHDQQGEVYFSDPSGHIFKFVPKQ